MSTNPEQAAMSAALQVIAAVEPTIADAIIGELHNQRSQLKLIASENYASPATLLAMGNWFSDKYAEGTVGHRFYAGCEYVDIVEARAAELACEICSGPSTPTCSPTPGSTPTWSPSGRSWPRRSRQPELARLGAKHVNDLSDEDWSKLRLSLGNQRMLGMSLDAGGHLTHGFRPEHLRQAVRPALLRHRPDHRLARLRRGPPAGPGVPPAGHRRRLLGVPAQGQLRHDARDRRRGRRDAAWSTWRTSPGWWPARCSPATSTRFPTPRSSRPPPTSRCAVRGAGWCCASRDLAEFVDKGCPMVLGGPIANMMAAKAVAFAEAQQPSFQDVRPSRSSTTQWPSPKR